MIKGIQVIKRDNRVKAFDFNRIQTAVEKAYLDVYKHVSLTNIDNEVQEMSNVMYDIAKTIGERGKLQFTVEEIQDIVVEVLSQHNKDVAKAYADYREQRNIVRSSKMELIKEVSGLLDNTNVDVLKENSNKQSQLASTQRDLIAGEVSKYIAKTTMIPKHLIDAHNKCIIKIYYLEYYLQPIYNCELVNIKDTLQN